MLHIFISIMSKSLCPFETIRFLKNHYSDSIVYIDTPKEFFQAPTKVNL